MAAREAFSSLHNEGLVSGAVELLSPLHKCLHWRYSSRFWPAAVCEVWPRTPHYQLYNVSNDAIEGNAKSDH